MEGCRSEGVERTMVTNEKIYYLPDGPEVNKPYKMVFQDGRLYVVPGGRWADQYRSPGHVMIYEGGKWVNITQSEIQSKTGKQVTDFTDIILDKNNTNHYFVTSYGTGLYEFEGKELVHHYTVSNSILGSAVASTPDRYTRIDAGMCDTDGVIWVSVAGDVDTTLVGIYPDRSQRGLNLYMNSDSRILLHTPGGLLQDKTNTNRKWVISCRSEAAVILLDDAGTKFDGSDDISVYRKEFLDQEGKIIAPEYYYTISQSPNGDVWIGSSSGPIIIPQSGDFMNNNTCHRLRIETSDGSNLFDTERINAFAWDSKGQIWIGTQSGGVYVLDSNCREVLSCYTSSNSAMPSNSVLSLAYDEEMGVMYIGTSGGLVSYMEDPNAFSSVIVDDENEEESTQTFSAYSVDEVKLKQKMPPYLFDGIEMDNYFDADYMVANATQNPQQTRYYHTPYIYLPAGTYTINECYKYTPMSKDGVKGAEVSSGGVSNSATFTITEENPYISFMIYSRANNGAEYLRTISKNVDIENDKNLYKIRKKY